LKGARGTLILLGSVFLMLGIFQFISAEENASRRIASYARSVNESSFDYDAEGWEKAVVEASSPLKWEAVVVGVFGGVFIVCGWLVFRAPLISTIGGLGLFLLVLVVNTVNNPASLFSGIVLKLLAIGCLIFSIREAVQFHLARERFRAALPRDGTGF
jgi:hypothetical protein